MKKSYFKFLGQLQFKLHYILIGIELQVACLIHLSIAIVIQIPSPYNVDARLLGVMYSRWVQLLRWRYITLSYAYHSFKVVRRQQESCKKYNKCLSNKILYKANIFIIV